jgi:hypothetical protein
MSNKDIQDKEKRARRRKLKSLFSQFIGLDEVDMVEELESMTALEAAKQVLTVAAVQMKRAIESGDQAQIVKAQGEFRQASKLVLENESLLDAPEPEAPVVNLNFSEAAHEAPKKNKEGKG